MDISYRIAVLHSELTVAIFLIDMDRVAKVMRELRKYGVK